MVVEEGVLKTKMMKRLYNLINKTVFDCHNTFLHIVGHKEILPTTTMPTSMRLVLLGHLDRRGLFNEDCHCLLQ